MITTQKGFWQDKVIAKTQEKLTQLYRDNPDMANSEKDCILEYWLRYEGLDSVLGDKLDSFNCWFKKATSPETITRCLRGLKEDGTIQLTPKGKKQRSEREESWRNYWGNQKHQNAKLGVAVEG